MSDRVTWGGAGRNLGPPLTPAAVEPLRGAGQGADPLPHPQGRRDHQVEAHAFTRLACEADCGPRRPQEELPPSTNLPS